MVSKHKAQVMPVLVWVITIIMFSLTVSLQAEDVQVSSASVKPATTTYVLNYTDHYDNRLNMFIKENVQIQKKLTEGDTVWAEQVVLLGDSITEGFNVSLYFPGQTFVNRGIAGDRSGMVDGRGLMNRLTTIALAPNPSHFFVMIGVNDLGSSVDSEKIISNYQEIVNTLQALYPKTIIVVESLLPCRGRYAKLNQKIVDTNSKLRVFAKEMELEYIDLYSLYKDDNGELKEEVTRDGIHLKKEFYTPWVEEINKRLGVNPK
ncbi:MAG: GDSL-type esterase/lipase family protein [Elusimicrobiota bacterium]